MTQEKTTEKADKTNDRLFTKHILPLTYKPKIPDVRSGKCIQTIRPKSNSKPKKENDLVMFYGWEGRPYHSKWNWREEYVSGWI